MSTRVKIKVAALIDRVEAKKQETVNVLGSLRETQAARSELVRERQRQALEKALRGNREGRIYGTGWSGGTGHYLSIPWDEPEHVSDGSRERLSLERCDRDLAMLRMTSEEAISIAVDDRDWGRYL